MIFVSLVGVGVIVIGLFTLDPLLSPSDAWVGKLRTFQERVSQFGNFFGAIRLICLFTLLICWQPLLQILHRWHVLPTWHLDFLVANKYRVFALLLIIEITLGQQALPKLINLASSLWS